MKSRNPFFPLNESRDEAETVDSEGMMFSIFCLAAFFVLCCIYGLLVSYLHPYTFSDNIRVGKRKSDSHIDPFMEGGLR